MTRPEAGRAAATRRHPAVWVFVSAAWLGPAILAVLKEFAQGLLGGGDPPTWRTLLWEGGDWLIYGRGFGPRAASCRIRTAHRTRFDDMSRPANVRGR